MQKDLVHIKDLDADVAMRLLENFDKIRHLVNDIKSVSEARYVSSNAEIFHGMRIWTLLEMTH